MQTQQSCTFTDFQGRGGIVPFVPQSDRARGARKKPLTKHLASDLRLVLRIAGLILS